MMIFTLIVLLSMVVVYYIADKRGANTTFWVVMAFIFGPLAIPFVFFSKPKPDSKA